MAQLDFFFKKDRFHILFCTFASQQSKHTSYRYYCTTHKRGDHDRRTEKAIAGMRHAESTIGGASPFAR